MRTISAVVLLLGSLFLSGCLTLNEGVDLGAKGSEPEHAELRVRISEPENNVSIDLFHQNINFKLPKRWKLAYKEEKDNPYKFALLEFIPEEDSITNWYNFFSIQAFADTSPNFTSQDLITVEAKSIADICRQKTIFKRVIPTKFEIENDIAKVLIGCAEMPFDVPSIGIKRGMAELGYYTVLKKGNDLYSFKRSIRTRAISAEEVGYFANVVKGLNDDLLPYSFIQRK